MQTGILCTRCNTRNDASRDYCVRCGNLLKGKAKKKTQDDTIWEVDPGQNPAAEHAAPKRLKPKSEGRFFAVCPECLDANPVQNGMLPLACRRCGYFFQAGIDRVISEAEWGNRMAGMPDRQAPGHARGEPGQGLPPGADVSPAGPSPEPKKSGPLQRRSKDESSLRFLAVSTDRILPETMRESGNIIGKDATVFKAIRSHEQLRVWHTPAGWYVSASAGTPLFNSVPMNTDVQKKLSDGDFILIEGVLLRAEIV